MSWRKHFQIPQTANELARAKNNTSAHNGTSTKFNSWLKDVYTGTPNRVDRYMQYEIMDADSEVNGALDTIAEFCTQFDYESNLPFSIEHFQDPTDAEVKVLTASLRQWCMLNDWNKRIWRMVRNSLKYGDQFFIRDPETYELYYISAQDVSKLIINEAKGKEIEQYIVKNISLNIADRVATDPLVTDANYGPTQFSKQPFTQFASPSAQGPGNSNQQELAVNASHVIHLSLSEGMDTNYPFGTSILEAVYKVFQQKSLLEDSIIIYRVQRAPERRVFYIDVGNMPANMAMSFVERVKNEIHQRRIPSKTGGGTNMMDASYNPLSMLEDYFFAQTAEGRGSKVEVLPGGDNLGQIDDLKYFTNKLMRALRIPSSYMPTGPDDGTAVYNDGRVGTAFIQEYRFNKYCQRLQNLIINPLDKEFKMFLKKKGVELDSSTFTLQFLPPQSFSEYREIEVNNARAAVFGQLSEVAYLSRRFVLKKYLGLTDEEIVENETMWQEENPEGALSTATDDAALAGSDLNTLGIQRPTEDDMGQIDAISQEAPAEPGAEAPSPLGGAPAPQAAPGAPQNAPQ
jgi:Bacteriophage T4-like portal protein (Gp20)